MKKTSLSKRVASVMLSLLMVVSIIPLFSVTAQAGESVLEDRYIVNNPTINEVSGPNLIQNAEDVHWSTNENAVHFNADNNKQNYLKVKFSDALPNVNPYNGFTISFWAKDSSRSGKWPRYFEITCGTPYAGGGVTYLYAAVNGASKIKYRPYGDSETSDANYGDADGNWHRFTFTLKGNTLTTYRDGERKGFVTDTDRINEGLFNQFKNEGWIVIGASSWDDPAYEGYIKDFRIYNKALNASEVSNEDAMIEEMLSNDYWGFKYDIEHPKYGGVHGKYAADSDYVSEADYAKTYKGLVYCSDVRDDTNDTTFWIDELAIYKDWQKVQPRVYQPVAVMYYTGKETPTVPVMSRAYHWMNSGTSNYDIYYYAIYLNGETNGMSLQGKWHGADKDESFNMQWHYLGNGEKNIDYRDTSDINHHIQEGQNAVKTKKKYWAFGNLLKFDGSFADSQYSKRIDLGWGINLSNKSTYGGDFKHLTGNGTKPLYAINAKPLADRIDGIKSKIEEVDRNVAQYGDGYYNGKTVEDYKVAIKNLLEFDPTAYNYADNIDQAVTDCGNRVRRLVEAYDNAIPTHIHDYTGAKWVDINDSTYHYKKCIICDEAGTQALHSKGNPVIENIVEPTMFADGSQDTVTYCRGCSAELSRETTIIDGANADLEAYNNAIELAQISVNDTEKYTEASRNELNAMLSDSELKKCITQDDIDALVENIITANKVKDGNNGGVLVLKSITFKVIYQKSDDSFEEYERSVPYGTFVTDDFGVSLEDGEYVYKWTMQLPDSDSPTTINQNKSLNVNHIAVTNGVELACYINNSKPNKAPANKYTVRFFDKSGHLAGISYVDENAVINPASEFSVPVVPFYTCTGFKNGSTVASSFMVTSDMDIYAVYSAK